MAVDQATGTTSTIIGRSWDDIPYGYTNPQVASTSNTPFLNSVGYSIANYLTKKGSFASSSGSSSNASNTSGLTRSSNNNGITTIPDLADINITHSITRLEDSTTYFSVVPSSGGDESIISKKEVLAAIEYRNAFKSGTPIADYVNFFKKIEQDYFNNQFTFKLTGDATNTPNLNDLSGFSNDSILFWVKKYFAFPELTKFLNATNSFYRSTWSRSTFNAIHLKFILEKYKANTKSFFKSYSDSVGLMANCKYHQLDSTQPIFDVSQDNYGTPIPFSANMENKVGPTARNLMKDLSKYNTTFMRHNLLQIAYYNAAYIKNMKVSSRVAHGCNLVNDIAFFVDFAKKTQTRTATIKTKFNSFNNKLYTFIQYISNIGNSCALNLRDIYAPINGYDKDFTVTAGSDTIAAQNVNASTNDAIDAQLNELQQFALADQAISGKLYADTASLKYLGDTRVIFNDAGSYTKEYGPDTAVEEPDGVYVPLHDNGNPAAEQYEENLPSIGGDPTVIEDLDTGALYWSDTNESLTRFEREAYLTEKEAALIKGIAEGGTSADELYAADQGSAAALEVRFVNTYQPGQTAGSVSQATGTVTKGEPAWDDKYKSTTTVGGVDKNYNVNKWVTTTKRDYSSVQGVLFHDTDGSTMGGATGKYHVVIDKDGTIYRTVPLDYKTTFAQSSYNANFFSVALVNKTGETPTSSQINAAAQVTNYMTSVAPNMNSGWYFTHAQADSNTAGGVDIAGLGAASSGGKNVDEANWLPSVLSRAGLTQSPLVKSSTTRSTPTAARASSIEVNQAAGTGELQSAETTVATTEASTESALAATAVEGIDINSVELKSAVNYASTASSRPYSNKQRMVPFTFKIRVEDIDGQETYLTVDYLLKKVVADNFNFYKLINTLKANTIASKEITSYSTDPGSSGQTLSDYISKLSEYDWRNVLSSGNITRALAAAGIDASTTEYSQLYNVFNSVLTQNALTSQTLAQGFQSFVSLGASRLPTNILGSLANNATFYDSIVGQLNQIGASQLPIASDLISSLNPFNYIDINISGIIPEVSLGSLDDIMSIASNLATAGPPTSIGDALDLAEQIKNIICNFEIPFINWPVLETLFKLKFNPKDIAKAIKDELKKIGDRIKDLFNPEKILKAIEQQIVSYFTTLYKRLFVCDEKASVDASGQEDAGKIVATKK